jgi:hypothetical protein
MGQIYRAINFSPKIIQKGGLMLFRMFKWMAPFVVLALLVGCATTPTRITQDRLSKFKKVGVVSLSAQNFYRGYTGLTIFGNEHEEHEISDWKIDDEYEAQMQGVLTNLAIFDVVRVPIHRMDFYPVYDSSNELRDWLQTETENWAAVEDKIIAFANVNALDAVIFVIKRKSYDFLAHTNQFFQGAGFYARGLGSHTQVSVLHLLAKVVLIDGQTGKPLASQVLSREFHGNKLLIYGLIGNYERETTPIIDVPEKLSRAKFNELDEEKLAEVRTMLIDLPKTAWEPTFRALFSPNEN